MNDGSYELLNMLRKGLRITTYVQAGELNTVIRWETNDGKVHEVCHSVMELTPSRNVPALLRKQHG